MLTAVKKTTACWPGQTWFRSRRGAGVDLREVQIAARHTDPRTTMRYDRARNDLDRHPNYIMTTYLAAGDLSALNCLMSARSCRDWHAPLESTPHRKPEIDHSRQPAQWQWSREPPPNSIDCAQPDHDRRHQR